MPRVPRWARRSVPRSPALTSIGQLSGALGLIPAVAAAAGTGLRRCDRFQGMSGVQSGGDRGESKRGRNQS